MKLTIAPELEDTEAELDHPDHQGQRQRDADVAPEPGGEGRERGKEHQREAVVEGLARRDATTSRTAPR